MNIDEFIERSGFDAVIRQANGVVVKCPAHEDRNPSLSVRRFGDRIYLKCFAGCKEEDILKALNMEENDIRPQRGCTLEQYAEKTGLPKEFLEELGLTTGEYNGAPAVIIPWMDETGKEISRHYRIAIVGKPKFRWDKGRSVKGLLYNIDAADPKEDDSLIICEGESDVHTLAFHGYQAVGIPGASLWENDLLSRLERFNKLYFTIEPDRGGETILKKLFRVDPEYKDKIYFPNLGGYKDPNQLYRSAPQDFDEKFKMILDSADSYKQYRLLRRQHFLEEQHKICQDLYASENILEDFAVELPKLGLVGDGRVSKLIYLCLTSRLFDRPCSLYIEGPSAAGKSFNIATVLKFFPESAYIQLTAMSEKSLAYEKEDIRHRFIVIYEESGLSASDFGEYLIRTLLSEGEIRYKTIMQVGKNYEPTELHIPGPIGLLTTTTKVGIHPENATRVLFAPVDDSRQQTQDVFNRLADETEYSFDVTKWIALQSLLECGERRVTIPFARVVAENTIPSDVRLRRDFTTFLTLIKAHAVLHQKNRQRTDDGKIIATLDDYSTVYTLVSDLIGEQIGMQIPEPVRHLVDTAALILAKGNADYFTAKELTAETGLHKSTVSRNLRKALKHGWIDFHDDSKKRNRKYILGTPIEEDCTVFPSPPKIKEKLSLFSKESSQLRNLGNNKSVSLENKVARLSATNTMDGNQCNQMDNMDPLVAEVADRSNNCSEKRNQDYTENQEVKPLVAWLRPNEGIRNSFGTNSDRSALPCKAVNELKSQVGFKCSACAAPCLDTTEGASNPKKPDAKPTDFTYNNETGRLRIE